MPAPADAVRYLDDEPGIGSLGTAVDATGVLAVDTEFNRTSTYRPELCLLQVCDGRAVTLVDMLAEADLAPVRRLLCESPGLKVLHAAKQDLEALYLSFGVLPNRIMDTQIAAGLVGHAPQIGYAGLVSAELGVELEKGETRTDWSRRPLTPAQLHYAADDVRYLPDLHAALTERLEAQDRLEWAREDCARLLDPALYAVAPEAAWRRLGGLAYLPPEAQARARRLAAWREQRATSINRPRQWVLGDKALLNVAAANPADAASLARVPELPPAIARRQARALLEVLADAGADPGPALVPAPRPTRADQAALKSLGKLVADAAAELDLAPELLATRRELAALLQGEPAERVTAGWRRAVIGTRLLEAVARGV